MSPIVIALLAILLFMVLAFHGLPVAFAFAFVGTIGLIYIRGFDPAMAILGQMPYSSGTMQMLLPLPLFILMGQFVFHSKISHDLFKTAYKWLGRFPGGIALATTLASSGFAACCGVSLAGSATMASIAYPELEKLKYDRKLSTGCIVAGGGLSDLIPPSLAFIIYGFLTETSIAQMFIAGIFPGIMISGLFLISIYIRCKRNPSLGPAGPSYSWKEMVLSLKGVWGMLFLFLLVLGGLYFGVFTPTEAGAAGATGAFLVALASGRLKLSELIGATKDTFITSVFILTMVIGANIFNAFLSMTGMPLQISQWILGLDVPRLAILICILLVYIPLGMFLDIGAVILLTIPLFAPPITNLGYDPIWFGVITVLIAEIGFMTPPVGINVFVVHGVTKVPLGEIFRGVVPFIIIMALALVLLVAFPQITLFLPGIMK